MAPQLSPAGSSTYEADLLHVGDGTWDAERETFLLPNLMGVNFNMMRYNGMGNRFRTMKEYHSIITAHAVVAIIAFLFLLPLSIFVNQFFKGSRRVARRVQAWIHLFVFFLATVVFALGWFAVGSRRSLTNPHHGIGLAIYVLVIVHSLGGIGIRRNERKHGTIFSLPKMVCRVMSGI